jgi:phosphoadenosine phosphosulfate reductase
MLDLTLEEANNALRDKFPDEIIQWALGISERRIVTTSFGIYSAVLLKSVSRFDQEIPVIWCDSGYNTPETYAHAEHLINAFDLNIKIYTPRFTRAYLDIRMGIPTVDDPQHEEFSEIVKLEPFRRALAEWKPEVWFTNIRTRQTRHRESKDILSYSEEGILKVSPFYYWSDQDLEEYLSVLELPKNKNYFDPVKSLNSRECGIHYL